MREREIRIEPQRLVKRSRRLDPDVVVKIGEALIVEPLRLRRLRPRIVMHRADAGANRDRALEQRLRNRGNDVRGVLGRSPADEDRPGQAKSGKPKMVALDCSLLALLLLLTSDL